MYTICSPGAPTETPETTCDDDLDNDCDGLTDDDDPNCQNTPPVADAGPDETLSWRDIYVLDGSGSTDADGDPLTYKWSFVSIPSDSLSVLSDSMTVSPNFYCGCCRFLCCSNSL